MKAVPRLPLNALRVFEAVARLRSMTRAAEALNVQPSAVSMQMKNLAGYVGVPLVAQSGRHLVLTAQGEALLPSVVAGLGQIEEKIAALRRGAREAPFTLSVLPAFLHLWLYPRLAGFEAAHPAFRLRIVSSRELADLGRGEADAAVRLGPGRWPGVVSRKLMGESLVPACAPALAKRIGRLRAGELPHGVTLLQSTIDPWTLWSADPAPGPRPPVVADDAISVVRAAEQGKGVALLRTSLVEDAFRERRLVAVGEPIAYRWSYYWVETKAAARDDRHRIVLQWLRAQVRQNH